MWGAVKPSKDYCVRAEAEGLWSVPGGRGGVKCLLTSPLCRWLRSMASGGGAAETMAGQYGQSNWERAEFEDGQEDFGQGRDILEQEWGRG